MRVAGVDGTKGGWVAIVLENGRFADDFLLREVKADFKELASAEIIAIDIPIGFGPRQADGTAREVLKARPALSSRHRHGTSLRLPSGPAREFQRRRTHSDSGFST
jgi:predicted RNase H-like nuclease